MSASFFTTDDGDWFKPTGACRGPWDPTACHAGPPTGLLARAAERLLPDQRLVRLTVDLVRPIPHAGFRIEAEVTRGGRSVSTCSLRIVDGVGKQVVAATSLHMVALPEGAVTVDFPTVTHTVPALAEAGDGPFPIDRGRHDDEMFVDGVEVRYPDGNDAEPGPTRIWMRTIPLLPDEDASPFQRICPLADCGNAISRNAELEHFSFLNTDLTIVIHRPPVGDWFGSDVVSRWEPSGLGMSDALLFDQQGPVGRALQSLLVRPTAGL